MPKTQAPKNFVLSYELLVHLNGSQLPQEFTGSDRIGDILALHASKLLEASLPEVVWDRHGPSYNSAAVVHKLTPLGRSVADEYARGRGRTEARPEDVQWSSGRE